MDVVLVSQTTNRSHILKTLLSKHKDRSVRLLNERNKTQDTGTPHEQEQFPQMPVMIR